MIKPDLQPSETDTNERTTMARVTRRWPVCSVQERAWKSLFLVAAAVTGLFDYVDPAFAQTWSQTGAPLGNWASIASSADGSLVLAADQGFNNAGSLYISLDSGATWTQTSAPAVSWSTVSSSADGTHLLAAAYNDFIYISTRSVTS